jgi:hypothetical protein
MSSEAQIAANCANAQLSTGPKTIVGLQASSQNNLRHGFSASHITLLPTEDQAAFDQLLAGFTAEWSPTTPTETSLVLGRAQFNWMSDRAARLQMTSLDSCLFPDTALTETSHFERLQRYQAQFDRSFHRTPNTLMKLRAAHQKEQIGFELAKQLAKQRAEAEAASEKHRDRQFELAELREQHAMQAEERAAGSEQLQIEKAERDSALAATKIATQTAKNELFNADWEAHALMNAPIPGIGYTQVQKDPIARS